MAIRDWPSAERPREKLLTHGPKHLSDAELLAIFLRTGCAGKSAVDLARDLLLQFDGLRPLLDADRDTFCQAKGLGAAKYVQLQAVLEMSRRHLKEVLKKGDSYTEVEQVKQFLSGQLRHQQREVFAVLYLDNQHRLITFEELFKGTINCAHVYPREIAKCGLKYNAAAVILAHNHPSGISEPSQADILLTKEISKALDLLEIRLLDHMIIGNESVTSLANLGLM